MHFNNLPIKTKLSFKINDIIDRTDLFDFIPKIWVHDPILKSWRKFFKNKGIPFIVTRHSAEDKSFVTLYKTLEVKKKNKEFKDGIINKK